MAFLSVQDFRCHPNVIPPTGTAVTFNFNARSLGVSQLRARYFIAANESFGFSPTEGADAREVFFPSISGLTPAPGQLDQVGPKKATLIPLGAPDPTREQPLVVNLEVFGFDDSGQQVAIRTDDLLITIDTLSMALGLISSSLGLTQAELSTGLGVSPTTLRNVMRGACSLKVREALADRLRGH